MGANHGPTRDGARRGHARRSWPRRRARGKLANLDLLRIHAHVTRPEFYDAADAAGLLLWQDFPLQWGYSRGARKQAARQAREMVDLLGHHPSIGIWCAHNEPLAVDFQPGERDPPARDVREWARAMFLPSWNKDVLDRSVEPRDPQGRPDPRGRRRTRAILPGIGSGGHRHALLLRLVPRPRWTASRRRCRRFPRLARFVSEFGAQAVPDSAEFMQPERWPDLDWDDLFEHHACQKRLLRPPRAARAVRLVRGLAARDPATTRPR